MSDPTKTAATAPAVPLKPERRRVERVYVHPGLLVGAILLAFAGLLIVVYSFNVRWAVNDRLNQDLADTRVELERVRGQLKLAEERLAQQGK